MIGFNVNAIQRVFPFQSSKDLALKNVWLPFFLSDILWRTKLKLMCNISKQLNYVSLGQLVIDYPSKYCYCTKFFKHGS